MVRGASPADWRGTSFGLQSLITGLVVFHVAAVLLWVFLLLKASRNAKAIAGKQQ
jgi:hypothetical protein